MNTKNVTTMGVSTMISVQNMDDLLPLVMKEIETNFPIRAYQAGSGLVTKVSHSHSIELREDEETGETYEICVLRSVARIQPLDEL